MYCFLFWQSSAKMERGVLCNSAHNPTEWSANYATNNLWGREHNFEFTKRNILEKRTKFRHYEKTQCSEKCSLHNNKDLFQPWESHFNKSPVIYVRVFFSPLILSRCRKDGGQASIIHIKWREGYVILYDKRHPTQNASQNLHIW